MLLSHPDVAGPSVEGQDLDGLPKTMRHFLGKETFRLFAHPKFQNAYRFTEKDYSKEDALQLMGAYALYAESGRRFIEKSPANAVRTRYIQSVFPDATFVIIVRNGFAVSEGIRRKRLYDPVRPHMKGLQTSIEDAALQWHHSNRIIAEDMLHLNKRLVIFYEDLVEKPEMIMENVCRYCKLDPSGVDLIEMETELNDQQIERLSYDEKKKIEEIARESLKRWKYLI